MAIALPHTFVPGETADAVKVNENFETLKTALEAGGYGSTNQLTSFINGEESRVEEESVPVTSFHTMPTKDQVTIVVPTNTVLAVVFRAIWISSSSAAGKARITVNGSARGGEGTTNTTISSLLTTTGAGMSGAVSAGFSFWANAEPLGNTESPRLLLGILAGGTYKISVEFKATAGTVKAKERQLTVWIP